MRWLPFALVAFLTLVLAACSGGPTAKDKDAGKDGSDDKPAYDPGKLVGTWEITKAGSGAEPGSILEFTKDGKMKMALGPASRDGTYKLTGNRIVFTIQLGEGKVARDTLTIKELTNDKLIIENSRGTVDELKKQK
jgi:uncharacterized protein (TIGR03066 family)